MKINRTLAILLVLVLAWLWAPLGFWLFGWWRSDASQSHPDFGQH